MSQDRRPSATSPDRDEPRHVDQIRALLYARPRVGEPLAEALGQHDWEVRCVQRPDRLEQLREDWEPTVLLIDDAAPTRPDQLPEVDSPKAKPITVLLVDRYTPDTLTGAMQRGASTLFQWPGDIGELLRVVEQELRRVDRKVPSGPPSIEVPSIVGNSEAMERIAGQIVHAAPSDANLLLTGDSGTGKELIARAVHRLSPRRSQPFVAVNCGAIPEQLVESELFGHEKGAFTNAHEKRLGRFELADGGTLFLDEVAELSAGMQVKLLRILQEQIFERVGGTEPISVDVRIIAATNKPLSPRPSASQELRQDLFFRLNVLRINAPPLRERPEDIKELWRHFIEKAAQKEARRNIVVDDEVIERLETHDWPGNIRELRNVARHAVVVASGGRLGVDCLPATHRSEPEPPADSSALVGRSLDELERTAILQTCEATETVKQAADLLGVSERTIYYRKEKYRDGTKEIEEN